MIAGIGLGANLGEREATLRQAIGAIGALPGSRLVATSSFYRSAPVEASGPDFVNAVVLVETALAPLALLAALQAIERRHGRERRYRNAPRTLDLDLLFQGDHVVETPVLTLPHPRLAGRAFVLVPLAEVAADTVLPGVGRVADLLPGVAEQSIDRLATR